MIAFLARHTDTLWLTAIPFILLGTLGPVMGIRRRTCLQLHVAAWALGPLIASVLQLYAAIEADHKVGPAIVSVAFVVYMLVVELRRYLRNKDDDDDDRPRRRRRARSWRVDLSGLVLPGVLPARG